MSASHIHVPELISPIRRSLRAMMPLRDFIGQFRALKSTTLDAIFDRFYRRQAVAFPPLAKAAARQWQSARSIDGRAEELLGIFAGHGEVALYVASPISGWAFSIDSTYWRFVAGDAINDCLRTGRFAVPSGPFAENSLGSQLLNKPLHLEKKVAIELLAHKPSESDVRRATNILIAEAEMTGVRLRKREFVERLIESCPGCSANRATVAWARSAPKGWKKPGAPKRR